MFTAILALGLALELMQSDPPRSIPPGTVPVDVSKSPLPPIKPPEK